MAGPKPKCSRRQCKALRPSHEPAHLLPLPILPLPLWLLWNDHRQPLENNSTQQLAAGCCCGLQGASRGGQPPGQAGSSRRRQAAAAAAVSRLRAGPSLKTRTMRSDTHTGAQRGCLHELTGAKPAACLPQQCRGGLGLCQKPPKQGSCHRNCGGARWKLCEGCRSAKALEWRWGPWRWGAVLSKMALQCLDVPSPQWLRPAGHAPSQLAADRCCSWDRVGSKQRSDRL